MDTSRRRSWSRVTSISAPSGRENAPSSFASRVSREATSATSTPERSYDTVAVKRSAVGVSAPHAQRLLRVAVLHLLRGRRAYAHTSDSHVPLSINVHRTYLLTFVQKLSESLWQMNLLSLYLFAVFRDAIANRFILLVPQFFCAFIGLDMFFFVGLGT